MTWPFLDWLSAFYSCYSVSFSSLGEPIGLTSLALISSAVNCLLSDLNSCMKLVPMSDRVLSRSNLCYSSKSRFVFKTAFY